MGVVAGSVKGTEAPSGERASVRAQSGSSFERTFAISAISLPSLLPPLPYLIRYNRRAWSKTRDKSLLAPPPIRLPLLRSWSLGASS